MRSILHTVSCRPLSANILLSSIKPLSVIPSSVAEPGDTFLIEDFISSNSSGVRVLSKHFLLRIGIINVGLGLDLLHYLPGTLEFRSHSRNRPDLYRIRLQDQLSIRALELGRLFLLTENTLKSCNSSWFEILFPQTWFRSLAFQ